MKFKYTNKAFALPVVMIASVVMMMVLVSGLSATTSVNSGLRQQHSARLQKSAAEAGLAMAKACIKANNDTITWTNDSPLKPNTDCNGTETTSCPTTSANAVCYVSMSGNVRTLFEVGVVTNSQSGALDVESRGVAQSFKASAGTIANSSELTLKLVTSAEVQPEDANFENPSRGWAHVYDRRLSDCCSSTSRATVMHTCALALGKVYCWGSNGAGQLGDGSTTVRSSPVEVLGNLSGKNVSAVAALGQLDEEDDKSSTCAIADGALYCWGSYRPSGLTLTPTLNMGDIGTNTVSKMSRTSDQVYESERTSSTTEYRRLFVSHSCVIASNRAYCWGDNAAGQLGDGTNTISQSPRLVSGLGARNVTDVKTSASVLGENDYSRTCAIADQKVYCWGYGIGTTAQEYSGAIGTKKVSSLSISSDSVYDRIRTNSYSNTDQIHVSHTCAIAEGQLYCWGSNGAGQLGSGSTSPAHQPALVGGSLSGKNVASVFTLASVRSDDDNSSTCAIAEGQLYCWGEGVSSPQLMAGSLTGKVVTGFHASTANVRERFANSSSSSTVSGYARHKCAIADDAMHCWGHNSAGQLGDGSNIIRNSPAEVGGSLAGKIVTSIETNASVESDDDTSTTCAVADARLYCWGASQNTPQLITGAIGSNPLMTPSPPPPLVRGSMLIY